MRGQPMYVLAIDPGPKISALVLWNGREILQAQMVENEAVATLASLWLAQCTVYEPVLAIEWITHYGCPVGADIFETCRWVGRFQVQLEGHVSGSRIVPRYLVKQWHCGRPSAKDSNVLAALKEKYGEKGTKQRPGLTYPLKGDLWQAFALATYVTEETQERVRACERSHSLT